jgi:drug/metabolite transporter (DMT)-like permease
VGSFSCGELSATHLLAEKDGGSPVFARFKNWSLSPSTTHTMLILLPLLAGIGYATAAVFFKFALRGGVNLWQVAFFSNVLLGLAFVAHWVCLHPSLPLYFSIPALVTGLLFFVGQLLNVIAIQKGDISVATPMLGVKVLMVALFSALLISEPVSLEIWIGGIMILIAVLLLQGKFDVFNRRIVGCIALALMSCVAFALVDVLTQKYALRQPSGEFLVQTYLANVLFSLAFLPSFRHGLSLDSWKLWVLVIGGSLIYAGAVFGVSYSIANYGKATLVNILYASRGFWSVLIVFGLGFWYSAAKEMSHRGEVFRRFGACLFIFAAILLVVFRG